ncbi:MAG: ATP synthase F1 subunit delta [Acidobacteria bacterium]|nr:ATP synthase F1 subunit delta [Acidobacteriota bacterium]
MGNRTMAVRYARALADVLSGDTDLARVQGELDVVAQILRDDKEIHAALLSSGLSRARKMGLLELLAREADFHPACRRILTLLAESNRLSHFAEMQQAFAALCDERRKIVAAEVVTAVEIDPGQEQDYRRSLERLTGRQVRLQIRVDPTILGGVVTRIGSEVYDGSVRGRLRRLQTRLRGE